MSQQDTIRRILDAMHVRPETAGLYAPHLDAAARAWGVADYALPMWLAQLAHESGNDATIRLLQKVVDIDDPDAGTVRLKRQVAAADEMALDTRSTKTIRVHKEP